MRVLWVRRISMCPENAYQLNQYVITLDIPLPIDHHLTRCLQFDKRVNALLSLVVERQRLVFVPVTCRRRFEHGHCGNGSLMNREGRCFGVSAA